MEWENIEITHHAMERFITRWPYPEPPKNYSIKLMQLLLRSTEENLGYGATIRMIKNDFKAARYFTADGWRFVTNEEGTRLLTCERIIFKARKPYQKRKGRRFK